MKLGKPGLILLFSLFGAVAIANATALIHIDLSRQTMHVESSTGSYTWPVSTARSGYSTPRGSFAPTGMQRMHYSKKYHNSPMPYSIFFRGGYAIHGTYATGALGRPASHGCVRLSPTHAAQLFRMVQNEGGSISITGAPPAGPTRYARRERDHETALAYAAHRHYRQWSVRSWQRAPYATYEYFDPDSPRY
ncbi:MAG TPA: L,D-transpeptidase [Methylocystis sp.]|nr:L,D-transpeptidase [Methylocystis sp.]